MNKINIEYFESPQLRLDCFRIVDDLKECWNGLILTGNFWRLYHNDKPGAGVICNGKKIEMMPDSFYLLPPNCDLKVWCRSEQISQFYLHFELTRIAGNGYARFNRLKITAPEQIKLDYIRKSIVSGSNSPLTDLRLITLAADCMSRLPENALLELGTDERIFRICSYIRENPAHSFTLAGLAKNCGMAPNSFLRLFRNITGVTPYQYILNMRYVLAAQILRTTSAAIDEVCEMIGVKDRFHFSRRFKNYYGLPPAAYRKLKSDS